MIYMDNNGGFGPGRHLPQEITVDIICERDEGIFLAVSAKDRESMDDVFDFVSTDEQAIEDFFEEVEKAKADYLRLKGES